MLGVKLASSSNIPARMFSRAVLVVPMSGGHVTIAVRVWVLRIWNFVDGMDFGFPDTNV